MQMKGKIRKYIPILMWTALLLAAGCGAPPVPPSDEEMTQHFLAHDGQDTTYTSLSVPYFSHGYSIGGTSKDFVYDPGLEDHPDGHVTEHGDLNEIYRKAYNDTTLYKRIKGDWYIQLEHDN